MILLHGESCNFSTTLPNMADGEKVYAFRSYHGRLSTSTAVARGSGTGDTKQRRLVVEPRGKQVYFGPVPPTA